MDWFDTKCVGGMWTIFGPLATSSFDTAVEIQFFPYILCCEQGMDSMC